MSYRIFYLPIVIVSLCNFCIAGDSPEYMFSTDEMFNEIGRIEYTPTCGGSKKKFISNQGENGCLMYGPYVKLPKGPKLVIFDNIYCEHSMGAFVDIISWPIIVAKQQIIQNAWPAEYNLSAPIPLSFQVENENANWEFRLHTQGTGTVIAEDEAHINHKGNCVQSWPICIYEGNQIQFASDSELVDPEDAGVLYKYKSSQLHANTGSVDSDGYRYASNTSDSHGYICFGPYVSNPFYGGEQYYVTFELASQRNDNLPNDLVARIDVADHFAAQIVAAKDLRRSDFSQIGLKKAFTLSIPSQKYSNLEFRVYFYDSDETYVKVHDVWMFSTGARMVHIR